MERETNGAEQAGTVGLCVFSGTGNTAKCAEALEKALRRRGIRTALHTIADGTETAEEKEIVICYPVYGFNMPAVLKKFCRSLPEGGGAWFLKTSGEPLALNGNSSAEMIRILRKKGWRIKGEFHFVMPYNMVFRHTDEMASLMWKTAEKRIPAAADMIADGTENAIRPKLAAKILSALCRIEHRFYPLNGRFFRVDGKKCIRCGKCAAACPTGNISFSDAGIRFGKNCIGCVRCSFGCPTDAIRIGLINFMRVNGPYDFARDPSAAKIGRYCRKAYERYFAREPSLGSEKTAAERQEVFGDGN